MFRRKDGNQERLRPENDQFQIYGGLRLDKISATFDNRRRAYERVRAVADKVKFNEEHFKKPNKKFNKIVGRHELMIKSPVNLAPI